MRCFVVAGAGTEGADVELCFDADAIPAVIDGGDGRLERTELRRGVETDDLEPPNASVGTTTTTAGPIAP